MLYKAPQQNNGPPLPNHWQTGMAWGGLTGLGIAWAGLAGRCGLAGLAGLAGLPGLAGLGWAGWAGPGWPRGPPRDPTGIHGIPRENLLIDWGILLIDWRILLIESISKKVNKLKVFDTLF